MRGTVRKSPKNYPFLLGLPGASERLELVEADLLSNGAYDRAIEGCDYVMHTASPYQINVKNRTGKLPEISRSETGDFYLFYCSYYR